MIKTLFARHCNQESCMAKSTLDYKTLCKSKTKILKPRFRRSSILGLLQQWYNEKKANQAKTQN